MVSIDGFVVIRGDVGVWYESIEEVAGYLRVWHDDFANQKVEAIIIEFADSDGDLILELASNRLRKSEDESERSLDIDWSDICEKLRDAQREIEPASASNGDRIESLRYLTRYLSSQLHKE